jgi:hypothetical protein
VELFEYDRPAKVVNTDLGQSLCKSDFGSHGSDPRTKPIAVERNDLTVGTTRGTAFLPGYQGHIPANSRNPYKARYEMRTNPSEIDKSNICQNFKRNMTGYSGYKFLNHLNDKGAAQITSATTYGDASSTKNWAM